MSTAFAGDLHPTATYPLRVWVYEPGDPDGDGRDGTLGISLRRGKAGGRWEEDLYAVELDPQTGVFRLTNLTDPEADEPYLCEPGVRCECMAGRCRVATGCKHEHALRAAAAKGAFGTRVGAPPPPPPEPEAVPVGAGAGPRYGEPFTPCPF